MGCVNTGMEMRKRMYTVVSTCTSLLQMYEKCYFFTNNTCYTECSRSVKDGTDPFSDSSRMEQF